MCTISASVPGGQISWRSPGSKRRRYWAQSRKFGMTSMLRWTPTSATVSRRRLSDTAVTACERSIEKPTTHEYDASAPISVMSVPCSVVTIRGRDAVCTDPII
jgi:hypothetical protein